MRFAAFAPLGLQLLCLFSIILNMPFKNLSNKCRKVFTPALRGLSPPTLANTSRHKKSTHTQPAGTPFNPPIASQPPPATPPLPQFAHTQKSAPVRGTPKSSAPAYQNIMPTSAACPHLPRRLQLLCLFSITLNVPFKNLSNKCRKAFAPALRGIPNPQAPHTFANRRTAAFAA